MTQVQLPGRTVLQIIPSLEAGGAERTTIDVAAALVRAGAHALVLSEGGRLEAELISVGAAFRRFPAAGKSPYRMGANALRLAEIMREEGVDIVHARSRAPAWSALLASRLAGVPLVTTYHGLYADVPGPKRFYNSVMARGDRVIANSRATAEHIARKHRVDGDRLAIIPRGTDFIGRFNPQAVDPGRPAALRRRWDVPENARVVLLPGRLARWKGHSVLIRAAARIPRPDVFFVLAGDAQGRTDYERELADAIVGQGLEGRIRIVGHVEDMPAAYLAADAVVSASTEPEAFGRVAAEAQGMGIATVVTELGATAETVLAPPEVSPDARTGWRVPAGDAAALAAALLEALAQTGVERAAYAGRARAHVVARFSLAAMTDATLDVYAELLGKDRRKVTLEAGA